MDEQTEEVRHDLIDSDNDSTYMVKLFLSRSGASSLRRARAPVCCTHPAGSLERSSCVTRATKRFELGAPEPMVNAENSKRSG